MYVKITTDKRVYIQNSLLLKKDEKVFLEPNSMQFVNFEEEKATITICDEVIVKDGVFVEKQKKDKKLSEESL